MKTVITNFPASSSYTHYRRPCPNAAEPQYFMDRLVDGILSVVTAMGAVAVFLFLITM